ncbi:MAG: glycoside hydrolase family 27 protein [Bacteroidales bacterium]|nr:glycoside hydrolase family 27 protein [Bacteroidales bacterium]
MKKVFYAVILFTIVAIAVNAQERRPAVYTKWEDLAPTPQMGWNSWNKFATDINEDLIKATADKMVELGLVDAGYVYLNLDDGWHGERDQQGFIHEDLQKFPSGIKALADYLHGKGLKLGIYSDAGTNTCACYAGSLGHEYQDAYTYASWGIDYLKYDWCYTKNLNAKGAYTIMRDALKWAGRPILFSMCEWGTAKPWEWAADIAHSWRTTGDIGASFLPIPQRYDEEGKPLWRALCVLEIIEKNEPLRAYAGPEHWNDPDMLEVGNGMSVSEDRAHFTLWCMMAAPLILGNDLTNMTDETLAIITNKEVIAIDQDPLGIQGLRIKKENDLQYWFKPLADGAWAFCILNEGEQAQTVNIEWKDLEFTDEISGRSPLFATTVYNVKDLWNDSVKPFTSAKPTKVTIQSHDVITYKLTPKN